MLAPTQLENPFWQFSLQFWKNEAAQASLLRLQDRFDQNINLLLFAIWLGVKQKRTIAPIAEKAVSISQHWQDDVVAKLRSARRALPAESGIRQSVKNVELEAERIEQAMLYELSLSDEDSVESGHGDASVFLMLENLRPCIENTSRIMSDVPNSEIISLVQAAYPALSLDDIQRQFSLWSSQ